MAKGVREVSVAVKQYLDERAAADALFAEKYRNSKKSFEECMKYIRGEARKAARGSCVGVDDPVVYGWAVHYYDEDALVVPNDAKSEYVVENVVHLTEEEKAKAKAEALEQYRLQCIAKAEAADAKKAAQAKEFKRAKVERVKKQMEQAPSLFTLDEMFK